MTRAKAAVPPPVEEIDLARRPLAPGDLVDRTMPLVMRGLVAKWPLVQAARRSETDFAVMLAGFDNGKPVDVLLMEPDQHGVIGYSPSMDGFNYDHHRISITQGLQRLAAYSREGGAVPGLAMQSAPVAGCLPGFLREHGLPFLADTIQPRIWIGNRVTTPTHFDESHNIACVVCGRRRFTLFPPEQVGNLYIGPLDFAPTGAAMSMARPDQANDPRYPRMKKAMRHAQVAELEPGDALYLPPLWWHHVVSLEDLNALVNYWWKPVAGGGAPVGAALPALLHCILTIRSLPETQRAAWRTMLEHYVFGEDDPAGHIPEARRGVLGPLTPETAEVLRGMIRKYL